MAHFHKWQRQNDRATWLTRVFHIHTHTQIHSQSQCAVVGVCVRYASVLVAFVECIWFCVGCLLLPASAWMKHFVECFVQLFSIHVASECVGVRRTERERGREREVEEEYKNNILVYLQLKLFKLRWNGNVICYLLYTSCCCSYWCCLLWFNCSRINRTLLKSNQSTSTF